MNIYEVLYMDYEMNVEAVRKIQAENITNAVLSVANMTWPPDTDSISITHRVDVNA